MTEIVTAEEIVFDVVKLPSTQGMVNAIASELEEARAITDVDSKEMAEIVQMMQGRFATVKDELDKERLATTAPLRDATKKINDGYNAAIIYIEQTIEHSKRALHRWNAKVQQERQRVESERRAAEKKAREEAEAQVHAAQQQAQLMLDEAKAAQEAGDAETAAQLREQAAVQADAAQQQASLPLPVPTMAMPESGVKGASTTFKARVTNKFAFIQHVAQHPELLECLDVNVSKLNALARVHKQHLSIGGIEAYEEETIRTRKAAV